MRKSHYRRWHHEADRCRFSVVEATSRAVAEISEFGCTHQHAVSRLVADQIGMIEETRDCGRRHTCLRRHIQNSRLTDPSLSSHHEANSQHKKMKMKTFAFLFLCATLLLKSRRQHHRLAGCYSENFIFEGGVHVVTGCRAYRYPPRS